MMKTTSFKSILPLAVAASLVSLALMAGCSCSPMDDTAKDDAVVEEESVVVVPGDADDAVTKDDAKKIALDAAGVTEADAKQLQVTANNVDGVSAYEVVFYVDNVKYEYVIDATTGDILEFEEDIEGAGTGTDADAGTGATGNATGGNATGGSAK